MQANFSPLRRDKQMRTSQRVGDHTYESSSSATFRATVQYQGNRMSLSCSENLRLGFLGFNTNSSAENFVESLH